MLMATKYCIAFCISYDISIEILQIVVGLNVMKETVEEKILWSMEEKITIVVYQNEALHAGNNLN
jgi:hypothetical protein